MHKQTKNAKLTRIPVNDTRKNVFLDVCMFGSLALVTSLLSDVSTPEV